MKENNTPAAELVEKNKKIAELVSAIEGHASVGRHCKKNVT